MSYIDAILQQKHDFLNKTGKSPSMVEIGEGILRKVEDEMELHKKAELTIIFGLKVVVTSDNTIRVK